MASWLDKYQATETPRRTEGGSSSWLSKYYNPSAQLGEFGLGPDFDNVVGGPAIDDPMPLPTPEVSWPERTPPRNPNSFDHLARGLLSYAGIQQPEPEMPRSEYTDELERVRTLNQSREIPLPFPADPSLAADFQAGSGGLIPYRMPVGFGESLARGANTRAGDLLGKLSLAPAGIAEIAARAGVPGAERFRDSLFANLTDPMVAGAEGTAIRGDERQDFSGKVGSTVGNLAVDMASMALGGGRPIAPLSGGLLASGATSAAVQKASTEIAEQTLRMGLPMGVSYGMETAEDVLQAGGSATDALLAGITEGTGITISSAMPLNVAGKVLNRTAQGAGSNVVAEEFEAAMVNPTLPSELQRNLTNEDRMLAAVVGGPMGAAFGDRPKETLRSARAERMKRSVDLPTPEANVAADITAQIQQEAGVKPPKPRGRLNLETGRVEPVEAPVAPAPEPLSDVVEDEGPSVEAFNAGLEALRARVAGVEQTSTQRPLESPTARADGTPTLTPPSTLNLATEPYRASQGVSTGVSDMSQVDPGGVPEVIMQTENGVTYAPINIRQRSDASAERVAQTKAAGAQATPIPQTNPESVRRGQRQIDQARAEDEVIPTMLPADAKYLSAVARQAREEGVALEPKEIYARMQALKAADTSRPAADSLGQSNESFYNNFLEDSIPVEESDPRYATARNAGGWGVREYSQANLSEVVDKPLYHETNLPGARDVVARILAGPRNQNLATHSNLDLALGQGGRGYVLEIDPRWSNGGKARTLGGVTSEAVGAGTEYSVNKTVPQALLSVTVPNNRGLEALKKVPRAERHFDFDNVETTERGIRIPVKKRAQADSLGTVDWNSLSPQEQQAFEGMFERRETQNAERELTVETATLGRQAAAEAAREMGLRESVETYSNATGVGTVYATTLDDLEGLVKPEVLAKARAGDSERASKGALASVRKGTYYEGNMTKSGKPLMVIYPENHLDANEASFTAAHELAGHHGIRTLVDTGKEGTYKQVMDRALKNPTVAAIASKIATNRESADTTLMTEEALAELNAALRTGDMARLKDKYGVEFKKEDISALRAFINRIINAIKSVVGKGQFSNAQVEQLLDRAWEAAQSTAKTRATERAPADSLDGTARASETDPTLAPTRRYAPLNEDIRQWGRIAEELFVPGRVLATRGMRGERGKLIKKGMTFARDLMESVKGTKLESNQKGHSVRLGLERAILKEEVESNVVREAMAKRDYSNLPPKVARAAEAFRIESDLLRLQIVEEMLAAKPFDRMTPKEKSVLNKIVTNDDYFHRSYAMDIDPQYANRVMNRVVNDKATESEVELVNRVTSDLKRLILIPPNLRELVESGRMDKNRLNELYETRIGPDADKMGKETLVRELEDLREVAEATDYDTTVTELRAQLASPDDTKIGRYFRGARADMGIVQTREDIPQSFREFWGEIDPNKQLPLASAITIQKQAALADHLRLLRYGESVGRRDGWLSDSPKEGYKELKGATFGMLQNKWVPQNVAEMLEQQMIASKAFINQLNALLTDDPNFYSTAAIGKVAERVRGATGYVKGMQVLGKLGSWVLNGPGNVAFLIANGNLPLMNGTLGVQGFDRGIRGVTASVGASFRAQTNPFTSELIRNNLLQSPTVSDINSALRKDVTRQILEMDGTFLSRAQQGYEYIKTGALTLGEAYAVLDLWATGANYFKNKDDIQKHWDKTGKDYSDTDLEFAAARLTRSTNTNWSMAPKIVQAVEKTGLTQFGVYFAETYRVPISNLLVGMQQMSEGAKTKDPNYFRVGAARSAGAVLALQMNPLNAALFTALGFSFLGDDEDEDQALAVVANNDFVKQPFLMEVGERPDGTKVYFDIGRLDAIEPSANTFYQLANGGDATGSMRELLFANTLWTRLASIAMDDPTFIKSKTRSRSPELFAEATEGDWMKASSLALAEILVPSVVTDVLTTVDKYKRKGQNLAAIETLANGAGIPLTEYHPLRSLGTDRGYARRFDRTTDEAWTTLSNAIGAPRPITKGEVMELYANYKVVEEQSKLDLALAINAAKNAGHDSTEIAAQLRQGSISRSAARKLSEDPSSYRRTRSKEFLQNRLESRLESSPETEHAAIKAEFKEKNRLLDEVIAEFNQGAQQDGSQ